MLIFSGLYFYMIDMVVLNTSLKISAVDAVAGGTGAFGSCNDRNHNPEGEHGRPTGLLSQQVAVHGVPQHSDGRICQLLRGTACHYGHVHEHKITSVVPTLNKAVASMIGVLIAQGYCRSASAVNPSVPRLRVP